MASSDQLHHVSSLPQLDALFKSTTYVFIDFYADWCGPCKQIAPFFATLSKTHSRPDLLAFVKVNVDEAKDVAMKYRVSAMPTFMFFKEGKQVAVNGNAMIQGADPNKLKAAAEKLGGLATKKAEALRRTDTRVARWANKFLKVARQCSR